MEVERGGGSGQIGCETGQWRNQFLFSYPTLCSFPGGHWLPEVEPQPEISGVDIRGEVWVWLCCLCDKVSRCLTS